MKQNATFLGPQTERITKILRRLVGAWRIPAVDSKVSQAKRSVANFTALGVSHNPRSRTRRDASIIDLPVTTILSQAGETSDGVQQASTYPYQSLKKLTNGIVSFPLEECIDNMGDSHAMRSTAMGPTKTTPTSNLISGQLIAQSSMACWITLKKSLAERLDPSSTIHTVSLSVM